MLHNSTAEWQPRASASTLSVKNGTTAPETAMSLRKLAYLDLGLFRSLVSLGTSKKRICTVLNLSVEEFDYVDTIV